MTLAWSPDNEHFATGGMDMMVFIWTVSDPDKRIKVPGRPHTCTHSCLAGTQTYTALYILKRCKGNRRSPAEIVMLLEHVAIGFMDKIKA